MIDNLRDIDMEKKRTTIIVDKELWNRFRIHAINQKKTASGLLEELIKKELGK
jgi:hypothetical protein